MKNIGIKCRFTLYFQFRWLITTLQSSPSLLIISITCPNPHLTSCLMYYLLRPFITPPEDQRLLIWDRLRNFIARHRRFRDAKWALNEELLSAIEAVADKLAPSNPFNLHQHLFTEREFDLYEENGNWEEQGKKLRTSVKMP